MQTLSYLTDVIGGRLTNSPQMKRANEWTRDALTKWGLQNARLEPRGVFLPILLLEAGTVSLAGEGKTRLAADESGARLDDYLSTASVYGFSGVVLIARDGKIVLHRGYNFADRENSKPIANDTIFDIGSLTKQFTAAAIMKLEMQGKLNTDDLLGKHLSGVPADKSAITLHHLLTHTAGFLNYSGGDYEVAARDETVRRILNAPLKSKPGEKYAYSNAGYTLLAAIVERVSGKPYEKFLNRELFKPAGMKMTGYWLPKWKKTKLAVGYAEGKNQGTPLDQPWDKTGPYWNLFGNGGMLSTAEELYKWTRALKGEKILSAAAKQKMFTPNLNNYAYGWRVHETAFGKRISHGGASDMGFIANFEIYPEKNTVIIMLTNTIPTDDFFFSRRLLTRLTAFVFGEPIPDFPRLKQAKIEPAKLKRYEGTYLLPTGEKFLVRQRGDLLLIDAEGQQAVNLLAFPDNSAAAQTHANLNSRAAVITGEVIKGNYDPLKLELKDAAAVERWQKVFDRWQNEWKEEAGKIVGFEILGTVPNWQDADATAATSIRVKAERGDKIFKLFWRGDKLYSLGRGGDESIAATPLAPQTEIDFVGYNFVLANSLKISFSAGQNGEPDKLKLLTKDGQITARKL
jgi:CubicO group peptidase (beta-lactamase class C family)